MRLTTDSDDDDRRDDHDGVDELYNLLGPLWGMETGGPACIPFDIEKQVWRIRHAVSPQGQMSAVEKMARHPSEFGYW